MNAAQIMSRRPVTAAPTMSVRDVAKLMVKHQISALPIVDDSGTMVGIVSEGDLVRRSEISRDDRQAWWLQILTEGEDLAPGFLTYLRSGERQVRHVMTREIVAVEETTPLPEIAQLLEAHQIKRVPVLSQSKLVGIVSRADLVRMLAHEDERVDRHPRPVTLFELSGPHSGAERDESQSG